jgi:hypothetical protein
MRLRRLTLVVVAFWVIGALHATNASAQFRLRIEDLASINADRDGNGVADGLVDAVVVTDQSIGDGSGPTPGDPSAGAGILSYFFNGMGGVTNITVSWSKPTLTGVPTGVDASQSLFLNSISMSTTGAANIRLTLEDSGFVDPLHPSGSFELRSHVYDGTFSGAGTMTMQSFVSASNNAPALGLDTDPFATSPMAPLATPSDAQGTAPPQVYSPGVFGTGNNVANDPVAAFTAAGPYSLWTQITYNLTGASDISFNQDAFVTFTGQAQPGDGTPEPASLMLISSGLLGMVGARRRQILGVFGRS